MPTTSFLTGLMPVYRVLEEGRHDLSEGTKDLWVSIVARAIHESQALTNEERQELKNIRDYFLSGLHNHFKSAEEKLAANKAFCHLIRTNQFQRDCRRFGSHSHFDEGQCSVKIGEGDRIYILPDDFSEISRELTNTPLKKQLIEYYLANCAEKLETRFLSRKAVDDLLNYSDRYGWYNEPLLPQLIIPFFTRHFNQLVDQGLLEKSSVENLLGIGSFGGRNILRCWDRPGSQEAREFLKTHLEALIENKWFDRCSLSSLIPSFSGLSQSYHGKRAEAEAHVKLIFDYFTSIVSVLLAKQILTGDTHISKSYQFNCLPCLTSKEAKEGAERENWWLRKFKNFF